MFPDFLLSQEKNPVVFEAFHPLAPTHLSSLLICSPHMPISLPLFSLPPSLFIILGLQLHILDHLMLVCVCMLSRFSHVWLFATPRTTACQVPLSMGLSR